MSLTISGLITALVLPVLVHVGFSEACGNEIMAIAPTLPGLVMAYIGRVRQGDISLLGVRR